MDKYLEEFALSSEQLNKLDIYYKLLISENQKYNLTSITDKEEVYIKHFYDSLIINLQGDEVIGDIGTGAGFPGLVLKIKYPHLKVYLIESNQKKCGFLNLVIESLNLKDVYVINARAEDLDSKYREFFDLIVGRAVSSMRIFLELSIPFLKVEGKVFVMKGKNYQTEVDESSSTLKTLNSEICDIIKYELPHKLGSRAIIKVLKKKQTNKLYPRTYNLIKNKPL
ncbi:MAG TPA: 16S rRNA (guanine(527)-N(7))-methyltransferase RsmG [Acholeplasma sp.]|jgi:16S rRNA (guanine527-N7)-methyltransferase|nr:16S rRNA (guanine(527)-N(7))-methyltransferase RsmG [Acholeplasma sp.]